MEKNPRKILSWTLILITVITLSYLDIYEYQKTTSFLSKSKVLSAKISSFRKSSRLKKGFKIDTYYFEYSFTVDNVKYTNSFGASDENAKFYLELNRVPIRYLLADPNEHILTSSEDKVHTISSLMWELVKSLVLGWGAALFIATVISIKIGWIKVDKD